MLAAQFGNLKVVKLLVHRLGASFNQLDNGGMSALHMASANKQTKVVKFLARHGADLHRVHPATGDSPAELALLSHSNLAPPDPELAAYLEAKSRCANPGCERGGLKKCARCQKARYCGAECQKAHWKAGHKKECVRPSQDTGSGSGGVGGGGGGGEDMCTD